MKFISGGSPGTEMVETGPGKLRNAIFGNFTRRGAYFRFESEEALEPPYLWRGSVRTISIMDPPVFEDGTPAWYSPGLVFHPMYGSSTTIAKGNDENVLFGLGTLSKAPGHIGISAELRAERPERPYGVRTGYVSVKRGEVTHPFWDNQWHDFVIEVHSHAHYTLTLDGVLCADVVEETPTTMAGKNRVAVRGDFTDFEIKDWILSKPINEEVEDMQTRKPDRVYDSRTINKRFKAGEVRKIKVGEGERSFLNVTCVNTNGYPKSGYLSVSDTDSFETSLVNWNKGETVSSNGAPILSPGGYVWIKVSDATHVLIDVFGWDK